MLLDENEDCFYMLKDLIVKRGMPSPHTYFFSVLPNCSVLEVEMRVGTWKECRSGQPLRVGRRERGGEGGVQGGGTEEAGRISDEKHSVLERPQYSSRLPHYLIAAAQL